VGISCLDFQVSEISLNIEKPKRFNVKRCVAVNYPSAGDCTPRALLRALRSGRHVATLLAKTCLLIAPADSHRYGCCRYPVSRRHPMGSLTVLITVRPRRDTPPGCPLTSRYPPGRKQNAPTTPHLCHSEGEDKWESPA